MTDLSPCPFCGGSDVNLHERDDWSWVSCTGCGLEAPTETGTTAEMAVDYWNKRAPHPLHHAQGVKETREATLKMVAALFAESVHETYTREEIVSVVEDMARLGRPSPSVASTQSDPDRCANCGYPLSEHGYNNACYGLCGKFVSSVSSTDRGTP